MKVQKRGTNIKGHTTSYLMGGKWRSRNEAYTLAKQGKVDGVMACKGASGGYIQSTPDADVRLYDLEEVLKV